MEAAHARGADAVRAEGRDVAREAALALRDEVAGFHVSVPGGQIDAVLPLIEELVGRG